MKINYPFFITLEKNLLLVLTIEFFFFKPTRKQLAHKILYATRELKPEFDVNYYLIHTRGKIGYINRQLNINYPNKIKEYNNQSQVLHHWMKQKIEPWMQQRIEPTCHNQNIT